MTFSGYVTRTIHTSMFDDPPRNHKIDHVILHHMASDAIEGVLSMWERASRPGSANYAISNEGVAIGVVPEEHRSWSVADADWDGRSITFEIENSSTGGSWPVSHAAHEMTAKVVADVCKRYGITCNRTQILGHREVYTRYGAGYATACPGGLDMDWIVNRAKELLGQGGTPGTISTGGSSSPISVGRNASIQSTAWIQNALIKLGYNLGPTGADDDYGILTTKAVHKFEADQKLAVDIGIAGAEVVGRLQKLTGSKPKTLKAPKYPLPAGSYFGPKSGPVQSVSGYYSHRDDLKRWQQRMHDRGWIITVDGLYGPETAEDARSFQSEKNLTADGLIGPVTWAAAWTEPVT